MINDQIFDLKRLDDLPTKPGVYLWKDKDNNVIYVGKAKNLKVRTKQYFKGVISSYKTANLIQNITDLDYILTGSDREALILERNLITKYLPKFNIKLTDDKHYPYLCLKLSDKLEIALVYQVKTQNRLNVLYYGPFPNGYGGRKIVNLLNRIYTYHQGLPIKNASLEFWTTQFQEVKRLLINERAMLIKTLTSKMYQASSEHKYEIAHDFKETIKAFEAFEPQGTINLKTNQNIDVIGFIVQSNYIALTMLFYRQGFLLTKIEKVLEVVGDVTDTIRQFASQYYAINLKPELIISNYEFEEVDEIKVVLPKKGQNKELLNLALENAQHNLEFKLSQFVRQAESVKNALQSLAQLLNLKTVNHLMIIDNSHTNNTVVVSVLLTYRNGIKSPMEFRKYLLKATERHADVEYMHQALTKHFLELHHSKPDLLIVDGGKAQLSEAYKVLPNFDIIGLVKDDKHQTKGIINQSLQFIQLVDLNLLNFLKKIQVEVDKYARKFHQQKRLTTLAGVLLTVPGIGPVIEKKLLDHFKTYSNIYNASLAALNQVIPLSLAKAIKKRLGESV